MKIKLLLSVVALGVLSARPAGAELVVLTNGDFFKVTAYELHGDRMRLDLSTGGRVTLAMGRIERIVDDEVLPKPEPVAIPQEVDDLALAFEEGLPVPDTPYGSLIYSAAKRHDLNPRLVAAVVRAESAFNHRAVSPKGARGLMQLM
ncbi:MAG: transglycosylase SLT domain-containing protein, partial [Acidobacteria bacterium]|nr:transglycosylase SLT domain-containing protein [Acidobacteriota bacterium]